MIIDQNRRDVPAFWPSTASAKTTAAKTADTANPGLHRRRPSGSRDIFDFVALSRVIRRPHCCRRPAKSIIYLLLSKRVYARRTTTALFTLNITDTTRINYITRSVTEIIIYYIFSDTIILLLLLSDAYCLGGHTYTITWRSFSDRFDHVQCARRRANHNWRRTEPWSSSRRGRPGLAATTASAAAATGSWPVFDGGPRGQRRRQPP